MSSHRPGQSSLAYLIDLAVQIEQDASQPETVLHRRDRSLVSMGAWATADRRKGLRQWLDAIRASGRGGLPGVRVEGLYRLQLLLMVLLGLLSGWGVATAVFTYDGALPVNVVHVLAVFVGAQFLLLFFLGIVLLPGGVASRVIGLAGLQELLLWLSPGQLFRLLGRGLPSRVRESLGRVLPATDLRAGPLGGVVKWAIVYAAQVAGVAFYGGALATALYLITFSDLAFSWSTTLKARQEQVHRVTEVLSTPWRAWWPQAVPSAELIRETQYYRRAGLEGLTTPERWGAWWPFLVAAMVTYGFLPRLGLWGLAVWRLHHAVEHAFAHLPGAALVWDRLSSQWVSTQSEEEEIEAAGISDGSATETVPTAAAAREFLVLNWGGITLNEAELTAHVRQAWRVEVTSVLHAGGRESVETDNRVIEAAARVPGLVALAVFVKAWEPPVLEVMDFLKELRAAVGVERLVVVCLVGWEAGKGAVAPDEDHARQWVRRAQALRDPALVVRRWPGGVNA